MENWLNYTDQQIETLINNVYNGNVTRDNLPVELYQEIKKRLNLGVFEGFGGSYSDFPLDTPQGAIMQGFESNIAVFSGAKTFQQVNDLTNFLIVDGVKTTKTAFFNHANEILETYNKHWLEAEFNTAISQGIAGRGWADAQETIEELPLMKYVTVADGRVSDLCRHFDGIVQPINSVFWKTHLPPNHFNCRCTRELLEEGEEPVTNLTLKELPPITPLFQMNAGLDKIVFDESEHPYFNVAQKYKTQLRDNFGLPFETEMKPAPKKKTPAAPEPQPPGFVLAKSIKDVKARVIQLFSEKTPLNIGAVTVSSGLDLAGANLRLETLTELLDEYAVGDSVIGDGAAKVSFASGKRFFGMVKSRFVRDPLTRELKRITAVDANFGSLSDTLSNRTFKAGEIITRAKSAVDAVNIEKATVVHEFAHFMAISDAKKVVGATKTKEFFKDLQDLKNKYHGEMNDLFAAGNKAGIYNISLGKYASTNVDEFFAEGFTEYRLNSNPSKYAKEIGKLIDKTFKR